MGSPFEALRSLARRRGDDATLAADAARALGVLADDPAGLVVACRRVLAHHRSNGSLWWLCAHLLSTADAPVAARKCARELDADQTASRLRDALGLQDEGERLGVVGWPAPVAAALDERFDLDVVAVVDPDDRSAMRRAEDRATVADAWEFPDLGVRTLLVVPHAASPTRMVVASDVVEVLAEAPNAVVWVVIPTGRLLPERLLDAVRDATRGDDTLAMIDYQRVGCVIDWAAVDAVADLATRLDCPIPAELLRPLEQQS